MSERPRRGSAGSAIVTGAVARGIDTPTMPDHRPVTPDGVAGACDKHRAIRISK